MGNRAAGSEALLDRLRTAPFTASMPEHLHSGGVGAFSYVDAGHVGAGFVGSAEVQITSSVAGETVADNYDVFVTADDASSAFASALANFSAHPPVTYPKLLPQVRDFCGLQSGTPDPIRGGGGTWTCWFTHGVVDAIVTITIPVGYAGDDSAVLEAMLSQVDALGG